MNEAGISPIRAVRAWLGRRALLFNVLGLGALVLVLLVPLGLIDEVLRERRARRAEAVASIVGPWGGAQQLAGPLLVVPFTWRTTQVATVYVDGRATTQPREVEHRAELLIWPEELTVEAQLAPEERRRGIFSAPVYTATATLRGHFDRAAVVAAVPAGATAHWSEVRVGLGLAQLRGVREVRPLRWAGREIEWQAGARAEILDTGLHASAGEPVAAGPLEFSTELVLQGSDAFHVVPVARRTSVQLASPWAHPSFVGAFLPSEREVGPEGFRARWQVSHLSRDLPHAWTTRAEDPRPSPELVPAAALGVALREVVDGYRTVERAMKYGALTLVLAFATFFLVELAAGLRLSGLHYLLVGAALCLFFLALLALAEVLRFGAAYTAAATAATTLIAAYSASVLGGWGRAGLITGLLGGVYGYLYLVLQLEDYSLLAGTAGLFGMLAATMAVTRRFGRRPADGSGPLDLTGTEGRA